MTDKKIDYHSNINQNIIGDFVRREVIGLASDIVSRLQENEESWIDNWDIDNLYHTVCQDCGGDVKERDMDSMLDGKWKCDSCDFNTDEELEQEIQEVSEYWFINDYLAKKLEGKGELIINEFQLKIWGRETTGQAILLDNVIGEIASDLEILDGQANDWSKK